jgi:uncharacterized phiE125 gp8 family phage protein
MWDRIERLSQPAVEPLSLADVKGHGHIDAGDEDGFYSRAIRAARQLIEGPNGAGLALVASQWRLRLDAMPAEIWIPMGPVIAIDTVAYRDHAGVLQTLDPAAYQWRQGQFEARIKPAHGLSWPAVRSQYDAVQVTFIAGFPGTDAEPPDLTAIEEPLLIAMLMLIQHWNFNRETVVIGQIPAEIQFGFNSLVNRYRVGRFA